MGASEVTDCTHTSLRFTDGAFYIRCTQCEASWVAFRRANGGGVVFDHDRLSDKPKDEVNNGIR